MAKKKTEAINYKEALSIQASLNDKKLGEVVERYNDFIERYEQFENNTAFSNLTFAEASLCAFDYAVNLDKENETGGFYQNLFRKWIEEFGWGKESGEFGLWSGKVRDLLEKGLVLMFNITDENGDEIGEYFRPAIYGTNDLDQMTNLEVGKGYLKKDDLKGLEYIIETVQSVQFPRLTQEEFELREEFEYYRKRHGSYERYQNYVQTYDFTQISWWKNALNKDYDYTYLKTKKITSAEEAYNTSLWIEKILNGIEDDIGSELTALENIIDLYKWLEDTRIRSKRKMTSITGSKLKGTLLKVSTGALLLTVGLTGIAYAKDSDNNTNLSDKKYNEYVAGLKKVGLYQNSDGTIGGVFDMVDGSTIRVTGLDKDGGLIGAVQEDNNTYVMKRFSYDEMQKLIERKGAINEKGARKND